jgi:tetratricopeptide (TPR) repeat protein
LVETGELGRTQHRHFEFYLNWAEDHMGGHASTPHAVNLDWVEEELGNVRAALRWSRANEPEGHLRLASALSHFWSTRGSTVEGRAWLEPAVAASADRGQTRADALWRVAMMAARQGDAEASRRHNREAINIYRKLENWGQLARVLNNLAQTTEDPVEVDRLEAEGLESARRSEEPAVIALLLWSRGERLRAEGKTAAARTAFEESLALRRQDRFEWAIARSLLSLAHLSLDGGDRVSARVYLEESLEIVRRLGDGWGLALVLEAFARSSAEPSRVLRLAGSARALRDQTGDLHSSNWNADVEEHLRSARHQGGPQAAAIEAAGYAMSVDEAVAEALSEP